MDDVDFKIYVLLPFKDAKIKQKINKENVTFITSFYSWWQFPKNISIIKKMLYFILYLFEPLFMISIYNKLKHIDFDIVHSNTSVIDVGNKIAKKFKKPHIWHFREYTGKHLDFIKGKKASYKYINDSNSQILYISKAIENFYKQNIHINNTKLIYDGINTHKEFERKYIDRTNVKFLFVGTLEENKGQMLAITACGYLKEKNINNYELLLIGGDPTGYSKQILSKAEDLGLEEHIQYLGFCNSVDKLRTEVDVELMCSPNEAFGLVTAEAMAMGNPVIGSNSGATPEIVDKQTGLLYEPNNAKNLSEQMIKFIQNKKLIQEKGKKAKDKIEKNFSIEKHVANILKVYKEVLK